MVDWWTSNEAFAGEESPDSGGVGRVLENDGVWGRQVDAVRFGGVVEVKLESYAKDVGAFGKRIVISAALGRAGEQVVGGAKN